MNTIAYILVLVVVLFAHYRRGTPYPHTAALKAHGAAAGVVLAGVVLVNFSSVSLTEILSISIVAHALRSWVYQVKELVFAYKAKKPLKPEPLIEEEEVSAEESAMLFAQFAYEEEEDPMMIKGNDSII